MNILKILLLFLLQPNLPVKDNLLNHLEGNWKATGTVANHTKEVRIQSSWVLNHQHVHLHEQDLTTFDGQVPYEADIYVGWDNQTETYRIHWLDTYGARFNNIVAEGTESGNSLTFVFTDSNGSMRNTWLYMPDDDKWVFIIDQTTDGKMWKIFASQVLTKIK